MVDIPDWLPAFFPVNPWTENTLDALYQVFERDLKKSQPTYEGSSVWFFPDMEDGKEKIFWHLTSREEKGGGERLPDPRRSERLPWVRPILDHPEKDEVLAWDHEEGDGTIKTYVWLEQYDFVVIMKKYGDGTTPDYLFLGGIWEHQEKAPEEV